MTERRSLFLFPLVLSSLGLGCTVEQGEEDASCDSISQCQLGYVCNAVTRECVDETQLGDMAVGRFHCRVGDNADSDFSSELKALITQPGEFTDTFYSWSFNSFECEPLSEDANYLEIKGSSSNFEMYLRLIVRVDAGMGGGAAMSYPRYDMETDAAILAKGESNLVWATSSDGFVLLEGSAAEGGLVEGYAEILLQQVPDYDWKFALGVPCPDGVGDCGADFINEGLRCWTLDQNPVCSKPCLADSECDFDDTICVIDDPDGSGSCLIGCDTTADCPEELTCETYQGRSACL